MADLEIQLILKNRATEGSGTEMSGELGGWGGGGDEIDRISDIFDQLKNNFERYIVDLMEHIKKVNFMNIEN